MSDIITSRDSVKAEECSAIQIQVLSCLSWLCGAVLVLSALGFFYYELWWLPEKKQFQYDS